MIELKAVLGILGVILAIIAYIPYLRNIYLRKTKPHAYSWLVWSIIMWIAFFAQLSDDGGPGAWVTGAAAFLCTGVFSIAAYKKENHITRSDQISLFGAGVAILSWVVTKDPLIAVILACVIELFGFYPTFRKSYHKPHEETLFLYGTDAIRSLLSIFALANLSLVTLLYPLSLTLIESFFVFMVLIRRKQTS